MIIVLVEDVTPPIRCRDRDQFVLAVSLLAATLDATAVAFELGRVGYVSPFTRCRSLSNQFRI
jgi:hypothetical protein